MTTRRLSWFLTVTSLLALFVMFAANDSASSAARDRTAPTAPANLAVTSITETTVTLSWNAASDNSGRFSYKLKINNLSNSAYNSLATISQSQTTYTARYLATDETDPQSSVEYEIYVNNVLSPLPVSAGVDVDFVYGTAFGDNVFYVKAVDRSGNSSAPSNAIKLFLWPC